MRGPWADAGRSWAPTWIWLPVYADLGLRALYIGDEAIIDAASFSLTGRRMRNVRQAVSGTRNAGVRTQILREAELDPRLRRALLDVAAAQRREFREFGFSMALGDMLTGAHPDCLLVVCRDRPGSRSPSSATFPVGKNTRFRSTRCAGCLAPLAACTGA